MYIGKAYDGVLGAAIIMEVEQQKIIIYDQAIKNLFFNQVYSTHSQKK